MLVFLACAPPSAIVAPETPPLREPVLDRALSALHATAFSDDPLLRARCARWLGRLRDPAYGALLARLSRDPDESVRAEALLGLAAARAPKRLELFHLNDFSPETRSKLVREAVRRGLFDTGQLRTLAQAADPALPDEGRLVTLLALRAQGQDRAETSGWADLLEADRHGIRIVAATAILNRSTPDDRSPLASRARQTLESLVGIEAVALARALEACPRGFATVAFAEEVFERHPHTDALVAAMNALLRHDPARAGLRDRWSRLCDRLAPRDEPVKALLLLRAAGAAAERGEPPPVWLAEPVFLDTDNGALAAAARVIRTRGGDRASLASMLSGDGVYLAEALMDWADKEPRADRASIALAVIEADPWAHPLSDTVLRAGQWVELPSREVGAEAGVSEPVRRAVAAAALAGLTPNAEERSGEPTDPTGVLTSLARAKETPHATQQGLRQADRLIELAEDAWLPAEWRAQAAWLAAVRTDRVPELLAALPRASRSDRGLSSVDIDPADTLSK
ncbi:MAG: HEAT repeat domain-containing protein [Phycisphaerales bacterium]